jgi:regulator of replication initiation timing
VHTWSGSLRTASFCAGDKSENAQLQEELESLRRQLAEALAREGEQKREAQTAHRQTDSAVAQLRTMQERLDSLEVSS